MGKRLTDFAKRVNADKAAQAKRSGNTRKEKNTKALNEAMDRISEAQTTDSNND